MSDKEPQAEPVWNAGDAYWFAWTADETAWYHAEGDRPGKRLTAEEVRAADLPQPRSDK